MRFRRAESQYVRETREDLEQFEVDWAYFEVREAGSEIAEVIAWLTTRLRAA